MSTGYAAAAHRTGWGKSTRACRAEKPRQRRTVWRANQPDREAARALVEAGYMPLARYIELFDEHLIRPPYNAGNFGEGDV